MTRFLPWLIPVVAAWIASAGLGPHAGQIGHDYYHQFPRFLVGLDSFIKNGLFSVPEWTASYCGGIAFFSDPQNAYFSLPQWLAFGMGFLTATKLTVWIFTLLGYWGMLRLARAIGLSETPAYAAAVFFTLSGFLFENIFVGHLTHHSYPLLPWVLLPLFKPQTLFKKEFLIDAALLALIVIYLVYSGSLHMIVVFGIAGVLALPLLAHSNKLKNAVFLLVTAAIPAAIVCIPKLHASMHYSPLFFKRGFDLSQESLFEIVPRYFFFDAATTPTMLPWGEFRFGAWEFVGWMSKSLMFLLPVAAFFVLKQKQHRRTGGLFLALLFWVCLLAVGSGGNGLLPFFSGYHNPIKLLAGIIPFFALAGAYAIEKLGNANAFSQLKQSSRLVAFLAFSGILLIEYAHATDFFISQKVGISFNWGDQQEAAISQVKSAGGIPPVTTNAHEQESNDWSGLFQGASSLSCYEPTFGYRHENLKATVTLGPTREIREGAFNITHPGCLVYPEHFSCKPWDRISQSDPANFEKFISGKTTEWKLPAIQQIFRPVALVVTFALVLLLIGFKIHDRTRPNAQAPLPVSRKHSR